MKRRAQDWRDLLKKCEEDPDFKKTSTPLILCDILEVLTEIDMRLTRKFEETIDFTVKAGCCGKLVQECTCKEYRKFEKQKECIYSIIRLLSDYPKGDSELAFKLHSLLDRKLFNGSRDFTVKESEDSRV